MSEGMEMTMDAGVAESPEVLSADVEQVETAEPEIGLEEQSSSGGEDSRQEQVRSDNDEDLQPSEDGRTLPKDVQRALKALRELSPENSKVVDSLRKAFFSSQQFTKTFGTPAQAMSAKAAFDAAGGAEGIAQIQEQGRVLEQIDQNFESGNPVVIDDVAKDFPEGFKKLVPYAIDKLAQVDPDGYKAALTPHLAKTLEWLPGYLSDIFDRIPNVDEAKAAKEQLQKLYQWHQANYGKDKLHATPKTDPERERFEKERTEFNNQREKAFRDDIAQKSVAHRTTQVEKELAPYLKGKNLTAEAKQDLIDGIVSEVSRNLQSNKAYASQVNAMLGSKGRDAQRIISYINAAISEATPKAVKSVWTRRYGSMPVTSAPKGQIATAAKGTVFAQGAGANANNPLKISAKPNPGDVDWQQTTKDHIMSSVRYMKAGPYRGKWVKF